VWSRLGSKVTVVEFTDNIAAGADIEVAKNFKRSLESQGMTFLMKHKVTSAKKEGGKVKLSIEDLTKGETKEVHF